MTFIVVWYSWFSCVLLRMWLLEAEGGSYAVGMMPSRTVRLEGKENFDTVNNTSSCYGQLVSAREDRAGYKAIASRAVLEITNCELIEATILQASTLILRGIFSGGTKRVFRSVSFSDGWPHEGL